MNSSVTKFERSPQVSGALRYERVAQLEAVLKLRDKHQRVATWRWVGAMIAVGSAAAVALLW